MKNLISHFALFFMTGLLSQAHAFTVKAYTKPWNNGQGVSCYCMLACVNKSGDVKMSSHFGKWEPINGEFVCGCSNITASDCPDGYSLRDVSFSDATLFTPVSSEIVPVAK